MFGAYYRKTALGRLCKITLSISLAAALAACSSASERFAPYQGRADVKDPGVQQLPNLAANRQQTMSSDSMYTASIDRSSSDVAVTTKRLAPIGKPPSSGRLTVKQGDTLYSLARSNGTTVDQLVKVNNLPAPYVIKPGQVLSMPGTPLVSSAKPVIKTTTPKLNYKKTGRYSRHEVLQGESIKTIADLYGLKVETVGRFNDIQPPFNVKTGQVLKVPYSDAAVTMIKPVSVSPRQTTHVTQSPVPIPVSNPLRISKSSSVQTASIPVPRPKPTSVVTATKKLPVISQKSNKPIYISKPAPRSSSQFRWPVKGRIISQYGTKPNGVKNDGINVAVPHGTSVKAAENGVVTYAGNELQGYGNLVIVSHADNWVTLYAHNSKFLVKKGQMVKRGQIISKAGQTGQVTSPQVHFEIRKGAKVVNPVKHMAPLQYAGRN